MQPTQGPGCGEIGEGLGCGEIDRASRSGRIGVGDGNRTRDFQNHNLAL